MGYDCVMIPGASKVTANGECNAKQLHFVDNFDQNLLKIVKLRKYFELPSLIF